MSSEWDGDDSSMDANKWESSTDNIEGQEDWQELMARKNDGSFWSEFELNEEESAETLSSSEGDDDTTEEVVDEAEAWLDTLASISAGEVEFNIAEADKADKVRQMQEWGFETKTIENTFGVAMDDTLEKEDVEGMKAYRQGSYLEDEDWKKVESHSKVEKDPDTGDPIRQQMVCLCWTSSKSTCMVFVGIDYL
jgi:hypothetical protein